MPPTPPSCNACAGRASGPPASAARTRGGDAGQECDDRGSGDPGSGDDGEAGTRRPVGRAGRGDRRHRCERRIVEQPEDDQAQAERPDARLRARIALHDRDADRVVDAARKGDPADTCGPARKGEGVGSRPFARLEEPLPPPGLEGVRDEKRRAAQDTSSGSAWWIGQPPPTKWRTLTNATPSSTSPKHPFRTSWIFRLERSRITAVATLLSAERVRS